ncbi:MAG: (E)-4-hydroxy-3-methylbut-2-enyl-diphosphate synthase [Muribaculaceae bacterium]|nr:(E)-4-hydroxy-3-methylbut-2-enyl-diphosphate synthase [Muribaculaceae bacterium]
MNQHPYRRRTISVAVGDIIIGNPSPIVIQSMTTTPTLDTAASAAQTLSIARAGASMVRLTAQGVRHAANLAAIKDAVRAAGCTVPLVADIHFNPAAAFEATQHVEKVRINPGNFFDPGRTFRKMEFTDEEYADEVDKIRTKFIPFLDLCRRCGTAIRIGVNHGSLSDRIMSRYGDGAEGMVESALEYLRICHDEDFHNVVVSIKASDVQLMTDTVRLLVERMDAEGLQYPLHLGVTEAGNALEGRIKSAVGIGSLLIDGIGDTIRVSLSEEPENEIPVARTLADYCELQAAACYHDGVQRRGRSAGRRRTRQVNGIGGTCSVAILGDSESADVYGAEVLRSTGCDGLSHVRRTMQTLAADGSDTPVSIVLSYPDITDRDTLILAASVDLGSLLLEGYRDGIGIESPLLSTAEAADLCRRIVQACGLARYRAEIVACPGCGRTLFDLPSVLEVIKEHFGHLSHLKIAVMGCIVNGPGEMAGADYGYVGGAAGMVSLYRGTECIEKNIPQAEAPAMLEQIIRADGQWHDPK